MNLVFTRLSKIFTHSGLAWLLSAIIGCEAYRDNTKLGTESTGKVGTQNSSIEKEIFEQINTIRAEHGLESLSLDPGLNKASSHYADVLSQHRKLAHDIDGSTPADRIQNFDYEYCIVTENIAWLSHREEISDRELARQFVDGWLESPGHRENILMAEITETGIAVVETHDGQYYGVQKFARPADLRIAFKISNEADRPATYFVDESYRLNSGLQRSHWLCTTTESIEIQLPTGERVEKKLYDGANLIITGSIADKIKVRDSSESRNF